MRHGDLDSGRPGHNSPLVRLGGVRETVTNPSSLRMNRLAVVVDGVGKILIMGGERVKPAIPMAGGAETAVAGGGETVAVEAGVCPVMTLVRVVVVVVDGASPARMATPLIQPSRPRERGLPILTLRFRPCQTTPRVRRISHGARLQTPGVHRVPLGVRPQIPGVHRETLGARLLGVPQTTLGPRTKPPSINLSATPDPTVGRKGRTACRAAVGRVGVIRRTLELQPVCPRPGEAGETRLRLSLRLSVSGKVVILNLINYVPFFYYLYSQSGALT